MDPVRRIRATHFYTGEVMTLYYSDIAEAELRNPGLRDFEYVGEK